MLRKKFMASIGCSALVFLPVSHIECIIQVFMHIVNTDKDWLLRLFLFFYIHVLQYFATIIIIITKFTNYYFTTINTNGRSERSEICNAYEGFFSAEQQ